MANLAVLERQQQFDFQQNGIEVMDFETLQRTYKENDIYNNPVQGIYHYQVIQRMMDICESTTLTTRWRKSSPHKQEQDTTRREHTPASGTNPRGKGGGSAYTPPYLHHHPHQGLGNRRADDHACRSLPPGRGTGGHRPLCEICHNQCILLRKEAYVIMERKGDYRRVVRHRGWLDGKLRGEHERGHRTDTEIETQSYLFGRNIYVYRTVDGIACFPRQRGQEPFLHRGDLSLESGADIGIHGRGAEAGNDKGTDYRLGSLQCRYGDIQTW